MVNYKLCIKEGKQFKELIWNKDSYERLNNHRLADIDSFTRNYNSLLELKQELIRLKALEEEQINKELSIRYEMKGKTNLVRHGIVLKDDICFFSVPFMKNYLKSSKKDMILLEKLCNYYRNSYANGRNVMTIRNYINKLLNNEVTKSYSEYIDTVIDNFIEREVYVYDPNINGYAKDKDGNIKIAYKSLHDLAMFLSYDYKTRINRTIYEVQTTKAEKPKIKSKKNDQVPGQYSLFD